MSGHHANDGSASRVRRALTKQAGPPLDLAPALLAMANQQARCARGEHDVAEVDPKRVTYVRGQRLAVGTKWCRYCSTILVKGNGPVP